MKNQKGTNALKSTASLLAAGAVAQVWAGQTEAGSTFEFSSGQAACDQVYFSRGRRVSRTRYERETLIYSYVYRLFKVRPVNQTVQEWGAYPDVPLIQLTLALAMSKEQRARSAGIGVILTDSNGVQYTSERGSFGECALNAGRTEGWIIDWGLGWEVPKLNPPLDIVVTNGDGSILAHLTAAKWYGHITLRTHHILGSQKSDLNWFS